MKHGFIGMNLVRDFSSINKGRLLVLGILAIYSFQNALMHLYANNMDGTIGIQGDSTAEYAGQEWAIRFFTNGKIEARNGSVFSTSTIGYSFGKRYHFRFTVDLPYRTYSVYVRENGGPEHTLGTDYSFGNKQSEGDRITGWSFENSDTVPGTVRVTNMKFYTECDTLSTSAVQHMKY